MLHSSDPEEARVKLLLEAVIEEHTEQSLATLRWTPGRSHVADALTKDNKVIAGEISDVTQKAVHHQPVSSYTATIDIPLPPPMVNQKWNHDPPHLLAASIN